MEIAKRLDRLMDSWPGFTFRVLEISRTDWETLKEYAAMFVPLTHENNYTPPNPKECDHLVYRGCEIKPTDQ